MNLYCPDCGTVIPATDVNLATSTAKCVQCNSVFSFDASAAGTRQPAQAAVRRAVVPCPDGFVVEDYGATWAATYRWFKPTLFFLLFFCIAWDGFLIFWYSMAFKTGAPWIAVVFPIVHLAVGIGLTYSTLAGFINSTRVTVDGQSLMIQHGPLPWTGDRVLISTDLQQLYCERSFSQNKDGVSTTFNLSAVLRDGKKLKLLSGFSEPDRALFLEQELERRLGIHPAPVAGEYQP